MGEKLTPEEYEAMALVCERSAQHDAKIGWHNNARHAQGKADAYRIAALALRYAEARHVAMGTAILGNRDEYSAERSNMHAAHDAMLAACKEATSE